MLNERRSCGPRKSRGRNMEECLMLCAICCKYDVFPPVPLQAENKVTVKVLVSTRVKILSSPI